MAKKYNISLNLSEEEGTLIFDEFNSPVITMEGYTKMNNIVNASIHMPDTILVNGVVKENPYIIKNNNGEILEVIASAIAFCKFNGGVVSANATIDYNVEVQYTNRLMEMVLLDKEAGHICKHNSEKETETTIVRRINDSLDLVADITNDKVYIATAEYMADRARAERKTISLAQRNAMKKLPPFSVSVKNITGSEGFRSGTISLILYDVNKSEEEISDILAVAKNLNAAIATTDLVEVNTGTVIECEKIENKQPKAEKVQDDLYSTVNVQKESLLKEISKLDKHKVSEAGSMLFAGTGKTMNSLDIEELNVLLILAKKLCEN